MRLEVPAHCNPPQDTPVSKMIIGRRHSDDKTRRASLAASILLECTGGASYSFSIYSGALKTRFFLSQQQLGTLSVFKDAGECLGVHAGLLYNRISPSLLISLGLLHNLLGYLLLWFFLTARLPLPAHPILQLCATVFFAVNAQTYFNTATIATTVASFPADRGLIVGLMKGCLGLSSAFLSRFWNVVPAGAADDGATFLLVAALVPAATAAASAPFVRKEPAPAQYKTQQKILAKMSAPVVVLAVFLMATAFNEQLSDTTGGPLLNMLELVIALSLLCLPCAFASCVLPSAETEPLLAATTVPAVPVQPVAGASSLAKSLMDMNFLLVLFASAATLGSGLAAVNSLSQVATAKGYSASDVGIFVTLVSTWQFVGRFGVGIASDVALRRCGVGRPLLTGLSAFLLGIGYLLVALGNGRMLPVGSVLIGLSVGANWSLNPTTVSELFALEHFSTLYNIILVGNPVASYALSVWVIGYLYDAEAGRQSEGAGSECVGGGCFRESFMILSAVSFAAAAAALLLWLRTRHLYRLRRSLEILG